MSQKDPNGKQQKDEKKMMMKKKKYGPKGDFETELAWCIEQLQLGLKRPNVSKEQAQESHQVMAKLQSDTVPLVKKRHLMRTVFGDYRKWMEKYPLGAFRHILDDDQRQQEQQSSPTTAETEQERLTREKKRLKRQRQREKKKQQQQTESKETESNLNT